MRKRGSCLLELGLGAHPPVLSPLALRQIEHVGKACIRVVVEARGTEEDRHTAAVLVEILLLEWFNPSQQLQPWQQSFVLFAPVGRREIGPAKAAGDEI